MTGPDDDATWRDIIANYGDRPVLDPAEAAAAGRPDPVVEEPPVAPREAPEERFVPPPPPPLPRVAPDRLAAWAGVFLSPAILLVATVFRIGLPSMVSWLLVLGFLGGFGYLVAQMPRGPRDPFDDGARL